MLGYCTNVHSGESFRSVLENINSYSGEIQLAVSENIGIGLWLSDQSSREVDLAELHDVLDENNLSVFTMNGFPYSNFHHNIVRHNVYSPNWSEASRLEYTLRLAKILSQLIHEGSNAGISTLPLGWNSDNFSNEEAATVIRQCVDSLDDLEQQTGRCIHIDLEAEPGCRLQRASEISAFMNKHFGDDERSRRYVRVCHDTCHSAVMHETAEEAVSHYNEAGLKIGKVQLSSAIEVDFDSQSKSEVVKSLQAIAEPRYLHQTTVFDGKQIQFNESLENIPLDNPSGLWRVHFHVPIHLHKIGPLLTTRNDLEQSIPVLKQAGTTCWEVETYTWSVIPTDMQHDELVNSIAKELTWAAKIINK
ncbi:MAG: metabolite traffic protein EboE [Planctomycetota bacterium]|nr:metabolite traffic protein EboE [Planctomycetota bacterium]